MKFMTTFLVVVLVLIIAAVAVPMTHEVVITTSKTLLSVDLGAGEVYRVTFSGTMAEYYDNNRLAGVLLDGVDCTPDAIKAAYVAAGFTDVSVSCITL